MGWVDEVAKFMDSRYRIPGTNIRFGADFLIGLIPYVGDVASLSISAVLVTVMARRGASGMVLVKMLGNILLDFIAGSVPVLGDLFDLGYKANLRNLRLLKEHYEKGRHQGSAWWVLILVLIFIIALLVLSVYLIWRILHWLFS